MEKQARYHSILSLEAAPSEPLSRLSDWSDLSPVLQLNLRSHFSLTPSFYSHENKENKEFPQKTKLLITLFREKLMQTAEDDYSYCQELQLITLTHT